MAKKARQKRSKSSDRTRITAAPDPAARLLSGAPMGIRDARNLAILFVAGLGVRLIYFFINRGSNPLFEHPILDALFHHEWAKDILSGNFWGNEVFFRAPLYPYFLAMLHRVSDSSITFAVLVQHALGALSVGLTYALARQYFTIAVALTAGAVAALYWPLIYFEGDLLIVTLIVFLDLAALLSLAIAMRSNRAVMFTVSGLVLGMSAIARPSILIVAAVLPLAFWLFGKAKTKPAGRRWIRQTVYVAAGLAAVISPILVRNWVVGRDFVPIASQGGVNFYIGNNPESNGTQARVPGTRVDLHGTYQGAIELAERDAGRPLKPSEVSNYYFRKGLGFVATSPGEAVSLFSRKFYFFWGAVERSNNKFIQFFWERFGLGRVPLPGFWLVGPFALLGGLLLWPRRRELSLPYLFVASYTIGVVIFFVNARFRLPVIPVLIVFAAFAMCYLALAVRTSYVVKALAALAVFAIFVNYDYANFRGVRAFDIAVSQYELGSAYLKLNDQDAALAAYEEAAATHARYPTRGYLQIAPAVDYNIGAIYWQRGLCSRAIEALERLPKDDPAGLHGQRMLASCYIQKGRFPEAVATFAGVLRLSPGDTESQLGLGVAYRGAGDLDKSLQTLTDITRRTTMRGRVNLELARTLELKGDIDGAVKSYTEASRSKALEREALLGLVQVYKKTGQNDKALQQIERLLSLYPNDPAIDGEYRALGGG